MSNKLHIDLSRQQLSVLENDHAVIFTCPVSSGAAGVGTLEGSGRTPTGKFRICAKIGDREPPDTIFVSRSPVGRYPTDIPAGMDENSDYILTRILWLDGIEEHNANTRSRYIYLHGTNRTDLLGAPASHGCIRLAPPDMLRVFELTQENAEVIIVL